MERIAPRTRYCVDESRSTAIDGGVRADGNLKFLDCFFAIEIGNAVTPNNVVEVVVGGVGSVDGEGIRAISIGVPRVLASLLSRDAYQAESPS